jgi:hypothetical protein
MKCRRAFEADLLAVLRGEGGDVEFLAHYPSCSDCAAELRVWGDLEAMLQAGAPAAESHPTEADLLAFVDAPATLAAETRGELERHVTACRTCADEIGSVRRFDPGRLAATTKPVGHAAPDALPQARAAASVAPRAVEPNAAPPLAEHPMRVGWLGRLVWHPAFAYALVVVLLVPVLRGQLNKLSSRRAATVLAQHADAPTAVVLAPAELARSAVRADLPASEIAPPIGAELAAKTAARPPPPPAKSRARQTLAQSAPRREAPEADGAYVVMEEALAAARALVEEKESSAVAAFGAPLTDLAATVRADGVVAAAPAAERLVLDVHPGAHPVIPLAEAERGPLLRITPPAGIGDGPVDVRVRGTVGGRELTERVTNHANAIELQIPPQWLAPGEYTVTLAAVNVDPGRAEGEARRAPVAATIGFTVGAPIATDATR